MRPNVLLIVFDTARADAFEPYGAPLGASPVVADLARRGFAMPKMFGPACWTIPSHASLFTGLLPRANGLIKAPGGRPAGCRQILETQRERLLPEVFRRAGYRTVGVSTNLWLTERSGFDIGFDEFVAVDTQRQAALHLDDLRSRLRWNLESVRARADDGASEARLAVERLANPDGEDPWFCFVNLIECHSPYLPPTPFNSLGPLDRWHAAEEARRHLTLDAIWKACAGGFDVPKDAIERMQTLYADSVRALDAWLGDVLDFLDRSGQLEDTVVIVTSDHGENLGEGGLMGHAFSLDQRLIHLPCVIAGPGAPDTDEATSLVALPAMLADSAGIHHPWTDGPPAGVAVAQFDPPAGPDDPRMRAAVEHWGLGEDALRRTTSQFSIATDGKMKLEVRGDDEVAFDLSEDPHESQPLSLDEVDPARLETLRAALASPYAEATWNSARKAPSSTGAADGTADLEERMRLLGYL